MPVYDVGRTTNGHPYIVSKYVEGSDLAQRMTRAPVTVAEAARWTATVAEALHYAHKRGLVHRDIKPGNILLDLDDNPYVVDFGLALKETDLGKERHFHPVVALVASIPLFHHGVKQPADLRMFVLCQASQGTGDQPRGNSRRMAQPEQSFQGAVLYRARFGDGQHGHLADARIFRFVLRDPKESPA